MSFLGNKPSYQNFIGILLLIGLLGFVWWSLRPEHLLIGSWKGKNDTLEIFPGNILAIKGKSGNITLSGSYQILDGSRAMIELDGVGALTGPAVVGYTVSADSLEITDSKFAQVFKRTSEPPFLVRFYEFVGDILNSII